MPGTVRLGGRWCSRAHGDARLAGGMILREPHGSRAPVTPLEARWQPRTLLEVVRQPQSCQLEAARQPLEPLELEVVRQPLTSPVLNEDIRSVGRVKAEYMKSVRDPLDILKDLKVGSVDLHMANGVASQVAPVYVTHIYSTNHMAVDYFAAFFHSRRLYGKPLEKESRCLAGILDDALYIDGIDLFNSAAIERVARRLYSIEVALQAVTSPADLDTKACWNVADQYDLTFLEDQRFRMERADQEVLKRLKRKVAWKQCLGEGLSKIAS